METCYLPRVQRNLPWSTPCGWHRLQRGRSGRGSAGRTPGWPGPVPAGCLSCLPPPQARTHSTGGSSRPQRSLTRRRRCPRGCPAGSARPSPCPECGTAAASPWKRVSAHGLAHHPPLRHETGPLETLHNCPRGERVTPRVTRRPLSSHLRSPESAPGTQTLALSVPVSSSATSTRGLLLAPGCGVGGLGLGQEQGLSQSLRAMAAHTPIVSSGPGGGRAPVLTPKDGHTR